MDISKHYNEYKKLHRNLYNRIIHIFLLVEIPYSIYLIYKKKFYKSIIYYIFFNNILAWLIGHIIFEKNGTKVFRKILKPNLNNLVFFTIYTPILRIIDLVYLIKNKNN
jgi:hypothetical protein